MTTEFVTCLNCGETTTNVNGECFGHPDAEPGWPVFHTFAEVVA